MDDNDITSDATGYETPIDQVRAIMHCLNYLAEEAKQQEFLFLEELILAASRCAADIVHGAGRGNAHGADSPAHAAGAKRDGCC